MRWIFVCIAAGVIGAPVSQAGLYSDAARFGLSASADHTGLAIHDYDLTLFANAGWCTDSRADSGLVPITSPHSSRMSMQSSPSPTSSSMIYVPVVQGSGSSAAWKASTVASKLTAAGGTMPEETVWQIGGQLGLDSFFRTSTSRYTDQFDVAGFGKAVHDWRAALSTIDPTYRLAAGAAIAGETTGYTFSNLETFRALDTWYRQTYRCALPIDVFTMRVVLCRADSAAEDLRASVIAMRSLMAELGYGQAELWITGYGIGDADIDVERISEVLATCTGWLTDSQSDPLASTLGLARDDDRLVQRWAWFSLNDPRDEFVASQLIDDSGITTLGTQYSSFIATAVPEPTSLAVILSAMLFAVRRRSA